MRHANNEDAGDLAAAGEAGASEARYEEAAAEAARIVDGLGVEMNAHERSYIIDGIADEIHTMDGDSEDTDIDWEDFALEILEEGRDQERAERAELYGEIEVADPGGRSALRAATPDNPRNLPCPSCGVANRLTPADRARGYRCDTCADRAEAGLDGY
jgi:hypothetical protein